MDRDIKIILDSVAKFEKLKNKTVLVTGATGRIGIYIVNTLIELNRSFNYGIHILALARNKEKIDRVYKEKINDFTILLQDVIETIAYNEQIDYIFHTAGLASPSDFTNRPIETLWGHVQGTKNVLDLAVKCNTKKVLYISTVEVYGAWNKDNSIKEEDMGPLVHTNSRSCYQESKRLCETMLACYKKQYGIDYVSIRMSHTLGPGIILNDGRAFAEFIQKALNGEDIIIHSNGAAVRTYTYTADAVNAMFIALLNGNEEIYNVVNTNNQISILELARLIASFNKNKKIKVICETKNSELLYLNFKIGILDSKKIKDLGWKPKINIKDTFEWTYVFFENGEK